MGAWAHFGNMNKNDLEYEGKIIRYKNGFNYNNNMNVDDMIENTEIPRVSYNNYNNYNNASNSNNEESWTIPEHRYNNPRTIKKTEGLEWTEKPSAHNGDKNNKQQGQGTVTGTNTRTMIMITITEQEQEQEQEREQKQEQ